MDSKQWKTLHFSTFRTCQVYYPMQWMGYMYTCMCIYSVIIKVSVCVYPMLWLLDYIYTCFVVLAYECSFVLCSLCSGACSPQVRPLSLCSISAY